MVKIESLNKYFEQNECTPDMSMQVYKEYFKKVKYKALLDRQLGKLNALLVVLRYLNKLIVVKKGNISYTNKRKFKFKDYYNKDNEYKYYYIIIK